MTESGQGPTRRRCDRLQPRSAQARRISAGMEKMRGFWLAGVSRRVENGIDELNGLEMEIFGDRPLVGAERVRKLSDQAGPIARCNGRSRQGQQRHGRALRTIWPVARLGCRGFRRLTAIGSGRTLMGHWFGLAVDGHVIATTSSSLPRRNRSDDQQCQGRCGQESGAGIRGRCDHSRPHYTHATGVSRGGFQNSSLHGWSRPAPANRRPPA